MKGKRRQLSFKNLPRSHQDKHRDGENRVPYFPEGGWGYVVVFAAFLALMTQMGLIVSMGVFLEHIEREFQSGAGLSGWISSGCFSVLAFASPIAGHAMNRFGCRVTAMVGGAIMCAGFVGGAFANSVLQLFMFADVIAGFGGSLCHISATCVVGQYFNKRYTLANCFAYTGQGVGIFIFPPILQILIEAYGWRGCMLVQGALTLNISAAAALYRPVRVPPNHPQDQSQLERLRNEQQSCETKIETDDKTERIHAKGQLLRDLSNSKSDFNSDKSEQTDFADVTSDSTAVSGDSSVSHSSTVDSIMQTDFSDETVDSTAVSGDNLDTRYPVDSIVNLTQVGVQTQFAPEERLAKFLEKEDEFLDAGNPGKRCRGSCQALWSGWPASVIFVYIVFLLEAFGYSGFFSHVVAKAHEIGATGSQATLALSIFGIGSLVGRASHGWIIDRRILTPRSGNFLALIVSGVACALVSLVDSSSGVQASAFFAGLGSGYYLPLQQVLLRAIMGQSRLHIAYGYGMGFEGVGALAGGFVTGYIRDATGSYDIAFYFLCSVFLLGSFVFVLDYCFERRGYRYSLKNRDADAENEISTTKGTPV